MYSRLFTINYLALRKTLHGHIYIYISKKYLKQLITSYYFKNVRIMELEVMLINGTDHTYSIDHGHRS